MSHSGKMLLLKALTALVVIGVVCLVIVVRAAPSFEWSTEPASAPPRVGDSGPKPAAEAPGEQPQRTAPPVVDAEDALQVAAEEELDRDPKLALELIAEGDRRFPSGRFADERQFLKLRAMVNLDQIPEARVAATKYLELNPNSPMARKIYRLLGIHPPPQLPTR